MKIHLLYFAWIREAVQKHAEEIEIPDNSDLTQLLLMLKSRYPQISAEIEDMIHARSAMVMAINQNYTKDFTTILKPNDEIAFIPPISGG
jgi:molybdopterin converting factor subunit 1